MRLKEKVTPKFCIIIDETTIHLLTAIKNNLFFKSVNMNSP